MIPFPLDVPQVFTMQVSDDKMSPTFDEHHILAIAPADAPSKPGVYLVDLHGDGKPELIRCYTMPDGNGTVRLWYDNPAYPVRWGTWDWFVGAVRGHVRAVLTLTDPISL